MQGYGSVPPPQSLQHGQDRRGGDRYGGGGGGGGYSRDRRDDRYPASRDDRGGRDRRDDRGRDDRGRDDRGRRSPQRRKSKSPSRSLSPADLSKPRKPRVSYFDILPPELGGPPLLNTFARFLDARKVAVAPVYVASATAGAAPSTQAASQQATRHARRVYVGGLPPTATEQSISTFFSYALAAIGGNCAGPGNCVVNVYINREKNFAFVEFRTVEETSNAMSLDGIMFEGVAVRVRRPNDYNAITAANLGPSQPSPGLNLAAIGLNTGGGSAESGPQADRVFVGGLPYYLTEEQCRELLQSFGQLKSFDQVKDKETGQSKGYGFVVYMDPAVTDIACAGLNGLRMGDRTLTVRRATETAPAGGLPAAVPGAPAATSLSAATRIIMLREAVTLEEIQDETEYNEIVEDMREECAKHGPVARVIIPRPTPEAPAPVGVGKVVVEFDDINAAVKARNQLHGRKFAGRTVVATYLSEEAYGAGQYDAEA